MRNTRILNTFLLIIVVLLIAAHSTNAQDLGILPVNTINNGYGYEYNADGTLDYDCQIGYNIAASEWLMACWVIDYSVQASLNAVWRDLDYALMPSLYDEDMYYSWEQWLVIFDELNTIAIENGVQPRDVDMLVTIVLPAFNYVCQQSFEACAAFNVDIAIQTYNDLYGVESA